MKILKRITLLSLILSLGACTTMGVKPFERDVLAKPEMALDSESIADGIDDHIYFSKEATSGGRSFAGGGCGCN